MNEFESQGELASSVKNYLAFGIFLFQLSMCGLFTSVIESEDLKTGSVIVVLGEVLYMIVFRVFNVEELKESFNEILLEEEMEENFDLVKSIRVSQYRKSKLSQI